MVDKTQRYVVYYQSRHWRLCPSTFGPVVQLVRTPACHAGGRGFESLLGRYKFGSIAQPGEHMPYKHGVTGSIPVAPINTKPSFDVGFVFELTLYIVYKVTKNRHPGRSY